MKKNKNNTLYNNKLLILFSLFLSLCLWFIVALFVSPNTKMTIQGVPVSLINTENYLRSSGVEIVDIDISEIEVVVEGNRGVVGSLNVSDIVVYTSFVGVDGPGKYTFNLIINKKDDYKDFKIVESSSYRVNVVLDSLEVKTFDVNVEIKNISIEDGYILGESVATPSQKTIRGPKTVLDNIDKLVAQIEDEEILNDSKTYQSNLRYLDKDGNNISPNVLGLDLGEEIVDVNLPVLKKSIIPLKIEFLNGPSNLNIDSLSYTMSHKSIEIAGPRDRINITESINLGYINLKEFPNSGNFEFDVKLPNGFINTQNTELITVSIDPNLLSRKTISTNNISIINQPKNFDVSLVTKRVNNIKMIGDKTQISTINSGDLLAEVDLSNVELVTGEMTVSVSVKSLSRDRVWSLGDYIVVINVKPIV
ncbi:MAG: CdaR family protein [Oscillospiraceae bacterium]